MVALRSFQQLRGQYPTEKQLTLRRAAVTAACNNMPTTRSVQPILDTWNAGAVLLGPVLFLCCTQPSTISLSYVQPSAATTGIACQILQAWHGRSAGIHFDYAYLQWQMQAQMYLSCSPW